MDFKDAINSTFIDAFKDFLKAEKDDFTGWERLFRVEDTQVYRRLRTGTSLYEYQTIGPARGMTMEGFYEVLMDYEYMRHWHTYCKELETFTLEYEGKVHRFLCQMPLFMTNREYIFYRHACQTTHKGKRVYMVMSESTDDCVTRPPLRSKAIRVPKHKQVVIMVENEAKPENPLVYMFYFDDPGGKIPSMLINWVGKTAAPKFLTDMRKAISKYPKWKKDTQDAAYSIAIPRHFDPLNPTEVHEVMEEEDGDCAIGLSPTPLQSTPHTHRDVLVRDTSTSSVVSGNSLETALQQRLVRGGAVDVLHEEGHDSHSNDDHQRKQASSQSSSTVWSGPIIGHLAIV